MSRRQKKGRVRHPPFFIGLGTAQLIDLAEAGGQLVAQPVVEEVEGHQGDVDGEAGDVAIH